MSLSILTEQLPTVLREFPDVELVYLFGSRVTEQVGPMSDYDLAILVSPSTDGNSVRAYLQHALVKILKTERVDVVLLNRTPVELAYHIIANGKLLFQKDLFTRVEYEAQVLGKYGDYLPTLRSFKQQTLQGDAHGKRVQRYREALRRTQRALSPARTSPRSKTRGV